MELVLIRLTGPPWLRRPRHPALPTPQLVVDVIWANAVPADRLEYVHTRAGPLPASIDLALFHRLDPRRPSIGATALALCQRAIANSPSLQAWTAQPLPPPEF
ncbi:hypothetical protein [Kitasatospora sp. LaBMicrA B282]|uniref:hypothetical protein n=1 Tax=Kitasatospora sp. LaBMicrA B282 TaxID=3420949 RepID=UPI003D0B6D07